MLGLRWEGIDQANWMQGSYDEKHPNNTIYYPISVDPADIGYNEMCNTGQDPDFTPDEESIVFPYEVSGGPTDATPNRIFQLFAQVDGPSGAISSLTFMFKWEENPGTSQPYYYSSCGSGTTYTETKSFLFKEQVSRPDFESVLCGIRAPCAVKVKAGKKHKGKGSTPTIIDAAGGNMTWPILPCWGEEVRVGAGGHSTWVWGCVPGQNVAGSWAGGTLAVSLGWGGIA